MLPRPGALRVIVALVVWLSITTMPDWFSDLPTPAKITTSIVAL